MKIEAKALLLDHAAEQLDEITNPRALERITTPSDGRDLGPDPIRTGTVAYLLVVEGWTNGTLTMPTPFTPGPPRPAPPPQPFTHAAIVRRSIAGDDDDATPRLPSLRGFLSAAAASGDWGVPIKSGAKWMAEKEGPSFATSTPRHDPCTGREHYALAARELGRIADKLPVMYGLTGHEQLAVWGTVAGAGRVQLRNIHTGGTVDAIDRAAVRAAKVSKRRKRGTMQPPQKRRAVFVPERATMTATDVADALRRFDVVVTPHQVGLVCRRVTERVRAAFERKGWIRERTNAEQAAAKPKGNEMATLTGHDLQGWKPILDIIGCSATTARTLMARKVRRLPVTTYLGTPNAKSADLRAWQDAEVAAALAETEDVAKAG